MILSESPDAIEEYVVLPEIGDRISVYEGDISIQYEDTIVSIVGRVFYSFAEKIQVFFEGSTHCSSFDIVGREVIIRAGNCLEGNAFVERESDKFIRGIVNNFVSNISKPCKKWRWCFLNAPKLFGEFVRRNRGVSRDRLTFKCGGYQIVLENKAGYIYQREHREISHFCELKCENGSVITEQEALKEIDLFSRFISFVFGRLHAPIFIQGLCGGSVTEFFKSFGQDDSLVGVSSWKPDFRDFDIVPLWQLFRSKNNESTDQSDVLNTAVHWYLQANMNKGLLEGALLLGFTGIELLSNVIVGKELNNVQIIGDLVSRLNLELSVSPAEIAQTRNYLMHYKNEYRRSTYNSLSIEEKHKRLDIVLQILELAILYWLGYEGHYADRFHNLYQGEGINYVPWRTSMI